MSSNIFGNYSQGQVVTLNGQQTIPGAKTFVNATIQNATLEEVDIGNVTISDTITFSDGTQQDTAYYALEEGIYTNTTVHVNSTGQITLLENGSGGGGGGGGNANSLHVFEGEELDDDYYPLFVNNTGTSRTVYADVITTPYKYNPHLGKVTTASFEATSSMTAPAFHGVADSSLTSNALLVQPESATASNNFYFACAPTYPSEPPSSQILYSPSGIGYEKTTQTLLAVNVECTGQIVGNCSSADQIKVTTDFADYEHPLFFLEGLEDGYGSVKYDSTLTFNPSNGNLKVDQIGNAGNIMTIGTTSMDFTYLPTSSGDPIEDTQLTTKVYVDGAITNGTSGRTERIKALSSTTDFDFPVPFFGAIDENLYGSTDYNSSFVYNPSTGIVKAPKFGSGANTMTVGVSVMDFSTTPTCSATTYTTNNQLTNKEYVDGAISFVDAQNVKLTGAQTIAGNKTFTSALRLDNTIPTNVPTFVGIGGGAEGWRHLFIGGNLGSMIALDYTSVGHSLAIGYEAGLGIKNDLTPALQSISNNIAIGRRALGSYTTKAGFSNVCIGVETGMNLDAGVSFNQGYSNVLVGTTAGRSITTGFSSTFVGDAAGLNFVSGAANVCLGAAAGRRITTSAFNNTILGGSAGETTTNVSPLVEMTGSYNFLGGQYAGARMTGGLHNIAIGGTNAGQNITTGQYNLVLGSNAGSGITNGLNNICLGQNTGGALAGQVNNIIMGFNCGTTVATSGNIGIGQRALFADNMTTNNNVAIGYSAAGIGDGTITQSAKGNNFVVVGGLAGKGNIGTGSTIIGYAALGSGAGAAGTGYSTLGTNNTLIGRNVCPNTITASPSSNVVIGAYCGADLTSGSNNILIGSSNAALNMGTSSDNHQVRLGVPGMARFFTQGTFHEHTETLLFNSTFSTITVVNSLTPTAGSETGLASMYCFRTNSDVVGGYALVLPAPDITYDGMTIQIRRLSGLYSLIVTTSGATNYFLPLQNGATPTNVLVTAISVTITNTQWNARFICMPNQSKTNYYWACVALG